MSACAAECLARLASLQALGRFNIALRLQVLREGRLALLN